MRYLSICIFQHHFNLGEQITLLNLTTHQLLREANIFFLTLSCTFGIGVISYNVLQSSIINVQLQISDGSCSCHFFLHLQDLDYSAFFLKPMSGVLPS